ncbi:MAG: phosphatase PAP2 family protein [Clostridiales bacterium]|nr:phosphatase PAP2 family protein [Clostridiales bacterium]
MEKKRVDKSLILNIILASVLAIGFLVLMIMVLAGQNFSLDRVMIDYILGVRNDGLTMFFKIFTHLGSVYLLVVLAVLIAVFAKDKKVKVWTLANIVLAAGVSTVVKFIVHRDRPLAIALIEETGYSFPSAHAMLSMAMYGFLIFVVIKHISNKPLKITLSILLGVAIFISGISRVYLGVHFATDIIAGYLLGALVIIACIIAYRYVPLNSKKQENKDKE